MMPFDTLRYRLLKLGIRTVGRLSEGIRLGLRTGFDSGTIVDYVYRNEARGTTPLGVLIDRVFLGHPVWDGVRARRELLIAHLGRALAQYQQPTLFDVAAGPGSYLFSLPRGGARYFAGDFSDAEVAAGQARARRESRPDITFARSDAFDPSTWPVPQADILVASGFFDILVEDEEVERLLDAGTTGSHPGSRWVLTVMERHTDTTLLRETMDDLHGRPWRVTLRTAEDILGRAAPRGWEAELVERERNGFFAVVTMRRAR